MNAPFYWLLLAMSVVMSYLAIPAAQAGEAWPRVAFRSWPQITVATMQEHEPVVYEGSLGSVQPKKRAVQIAKRQCNERRPDGTWIPVRCGESN